MSSRHSTTSPASSLFPLAIQRMILCGNGGKRTCHAGGAVNGFRAKTLRRHTICLPLNVYQWPSRTKLPTSTVSFGNSGTSSETPRSFSPVVATPIIEILRANANTILLMSLLLPAIRCSPFLIVFRGPGVNASIGNAARFIESPFSQ